jgi:hypothetical protein
VTTTAVDPSANTYVTRILGVDSSSVIGTGPELLLVDLHKLNGDFQQRQRHRRDGFVGATTYIYGTDRKHRILHKNDAVHIGGVSAVNQYISDFTLPSITSISATTATDTTTDVAWEGLYDTTTKHRGLDVSGVPDLSANVAGRRPLAGCRQHAVLFQGDAVFVRWGGGAVSSVVKVTTQPAIVSVSSEVIDNSGVAVYWEGTGETVDILWNTTGYLTLTAFENAQRHRQLFLSR